MPEGTAHGRSKFDERHVNGHSSPNSGAPWGLGSRQVRVRFSQSQVNIAMPLGE